jgi:hypothetical protein
MSTKMKGGSEMSRSGNLSEGMTRKAPKAVDESMTPPKGSVDSDTTRDGVAPTPKTLGPREA